MAELPVAPITRIIKQAGAERVSGDASTTLVELVEQYARKVAEEAVALAKHSGRKTVKKEDIEEAAKRV
ncbi:MAG: histone family protein [Candidatus Methanospirare jalkutatii]|nr:histone family protein [Methanophagales archaeon]MCW3132328.1 histone family protein [Candidatus Methanospirare jalkutatii]MCR5853174.1 histone family protein [Methanophagales archaeon]MCU4140495.1 Archaeal histone H3/H4 [Methanophagales archaeon]MCW7074841.1 histone family protein [Candidatus Methanospirare jalkutatii]